MLALQRNYGVARDEAAEILWPEAPSDKARNSLKQALALLRKALPDHAVESSHSHIRLSEDFRLITDVEDPLLRKSNAFLPGFEGSWFEDQRSALTVREEIELAPGPNPFQAFDSLAEWYFQLSADRGFAFLRENLGMTLGLSEMTRRLIRTSKPTDIRWIGWSLYLRGCHELCCKNVVKGGQLCRQAAQYGLEQGDLMLAVQSIAQYALSESFQGRVSAAMEIARNALQVASRSQDKELTATANQMFGNILVHANDLKQGLYYMETAEQIYADPVDTLIIQGLRSFYLSLFGNYGKAAEIIEAMNCAGGHRIGHPFLNANVGCARAQIYLSDANFEKAIEVGQVSLEGARRMHNLHQVIVANEVLANAYRRAGELQDSQMRLEEAVSLRRSLSMAHKPWRANTVSSLIA